MSTPEQARAYDRAEPIYLVEITPLAGGAPVLYLSTRGATVEGVEYEAYIADVEGVGAMLGRRDSGGLNSVMRIRFLNEPWRGYSRLVALSADYPLEGAACLIKEAYMGPDGAPTSAVLLHKGVLDGPAGTGLMEFYSDVTSLECRADMK